MSIRKKKQTAGKDSYFDPQEEKIRFRAKDWWKYLISLVLIVIYLFPFYVIINVSLKSFTDTTSRIQFPAEIYWGNYESVISSGDIFMGIKNSLIITVFVLLVEIVLGCMAAYALARNQSKLNEVVRSLIMSVMMITPLTILVGVYSTMSAIHATSTYWGMVVVLSAFGLPLTILLYTNFISSIPTSLDEAAAIDGATPVKSFFYITLPLLMPAISSAVIINLIGGLKLYDVVVSLSGGGPGYETSSLSFYINNRYFQAEQAGYASAVGVVMFLFILICSLIVNHYFKKREVEL